MSIAAGALYVRKYFNEEAKKNALEMVSDIREEFEEILKEVDWMDEKTRANALDKARSMATHIAYPDELLDDRKLEEFYEGVGRRCNFLWRYCFFFYVRSARPTVFAVLAFYSKYYYFSWNLTNLNT